MSDEKKGLILGTSTFIMWGVFPIFFKFIDHINSLEILAHRIVWSSVLLLIFLLLTKRLKNVFTILRLPKAIFMLLLSGVLISINWGVFIWAVKNDEILQASLGYFIGPLISILLGATILKEKLNTLTKISILIVFMAIGVQIYSIKALPLVSIILPLSFALYGLVRKRAGIAAFEGIFIETFFMFILSIIFLSYLGIKGSGSFGFNTNGLLLFLSGLVTVIPLLTFNASTKFLNLSTIGFLQYISPSLSLLIAIFLYNEPVDAYKITSFLLIWIGLIVASYGQIGGKK